MILYGCGPSRISIYRRDRIAKDHQLISIGRHDDVGAVYNRDAFFFKKDLYGLLVESISNQKIDLVVSDEDGWSKKISKDLNLPIIEVSSIKTNLHPNVIIDSPFIHGQTCNYPMRHVNDNIDLICLMRNPNRYQKILAILQEGDVSYTIHDKLDESFWNDECKSLIFLCEGDADSVEIALTGQHPTILIPSREDREQKKISALADKIGIVNVGEIERNKYPKEKLSWAINAVTSSKWMKKKLPSLSEIIKTMLDK